ncbi:protein of unknown function [Xenorhabdus poinarii G6]|uniref:Uncharacterized protein n=1 Tax=Xenorhabdus poinarii G6 TaxID=1354304 RepID=A0A068R436_9GAMM|nr:protein of unknown function [Xenorhabdus poinarii G6]
MSLVRVQLEEPNLNIMPNEPSMVLRLKKSAYQIKRLPIGKPFFISFSCYPFKNPFVIDLPLADFVFVYAIRIKIRDNSSNNKIKLISTE